MKDDLETKYYLDDPECFEPEPEPPRRRRHGFLRFLLTLILIIPFLTGVKLTIIVINIITIMHIAGSLLALMLHGFEFFRIHVEFEDVGALDRGDVGILVQEENVVVKFDLFGFGIALVAKIVSESR